MYCRCVEFCKADEIFPSRKLIVGNPARIVRDLTDEMIDWKTAGTRLYQQLPADCHQTLKEVAPLREIPENRPIQENFYKTLNEFRKNKN